MPGAEAVATAGENSAPTTGDAVANGAASSSGNTAENGSGGCAAAAEGQASRAAVMQALSTLMTSKDVKVWTGDPSLANALGATAGLHILIWPLYLSRSELLATHRCTQYMSKMVWIRRMGIEDLI